MNSLQVLSKAGLGKTFLLQHLTNYLIDRYSYPGGV